ncbi:hypothetical protein QE375_001963 [Microbacterium foliorum]|uniref:AbiV family abortive infection protein n=1 Tax=Microbacterium foliorum TaxID=104336 RepID=A0ABU1HSV9_9MICO|nr:hypothetical protein [Microbacterium foliorum]MDR6142409.1 hypothetical protein [Microbacterium foliorum]
MAGLDSSERLNLAVGIFLAGTSKLDEALELLLANMVYDESPRFKLARGRMMADKIRLVDALWPSVWADGPVFVNALSAITRRRNRFAHWVPHPDWSTIFADPEASAVDYPMLHLNPRNPGFETAIPFDLDSTWNDHLSQRLLANLCLNLTLELGEGRTRAVDSLEGYLLAWAEEDYSGLGDEGQEFWPQDSRWSADVRRALHPTP